jgi:hypothetical protein
MNGTNPRLTSGELLAIFVLSLFFFLLGCSAGPQPTTAHTPAMPAAVEPEQPQSAHLHFAPSADWEGMPAKPFEEALLSSLQSLLSLVELPAPGEKHVLLTDSLMDGSSGVQSLATRRIESRLADLARKSIRISPCSRSCPFTLTSHPWCWWEPSARSTLPVTPRAGAKASAFVSPWRTSSQVK